MTNITQQISKPKLLIGEGWEEVYFFDALLAHLNISDFQLEQEVRIGCRVISRRCRTGQAIDKSLPWVSHGMRTTTRKMHFEASVAR